MASRQMTGESTLALVEDRTMLPKTAQQVYLQDHLQRVHNEIESTTRKLELEKRRLNKLDEDVARMRAEHQQKVLMRGPPKSAEPEHGPSTKKLEHRLAKAISQLNALCHENQDIRAKIDTSRRERLQMNQVFKKLQNDIKDNIQQVSQLQKDTDKTRMEHEERQHRIAALRKNELHELTQKVERGKRQEEDRKHKTQSLKADE